MRVNTHTYWYFPGILPDKFCEDIKRFAAEHNKKEEAQTGFSHLDNYTVYKKRALKKLHRTRKSTVTWLDEPWIHLELDKLARMANKHSGWDLSWSTGEGIQFTEYSRSGHYEWHQDKWEKPIHRPGHWLHNTNRQLSMTANLNDPKHYGGGCLQFSIIDKGKAKILTCKEILPKGSVCVFPSEMWHRVTPVTRGKRISLVRWLSG